MPCVCKHTLPLAATLHKLAKTARKPPSCILSQHLHARKNCCACTDVCMRRPDKTSTEPKTSHLHQTKPSDKDMHLCVPRLAAKSCASPGELGFPSRTNAPGAGCAPSEGLAVPTLTCDWRSLKKTLPAAPQCDFRQCIMSRSRETNCLPPYSVTTSPDMCTDRCQHCTIRNKVPRTNTSVTLGIMNTSYSPGPRSSPNQTEAPLAAEKRTMHAALRKLHAPESHTQSCAALHYT